MSVSLLNPSCSTSLQSSSPASVQSSSSSSSSDSPAQYACTDCGLQFRRLATYRRHEKLYHSADDVTSYTARRRASPPSNRRQGPAATDDDVVSMETVENCCHDNEISLPVEDDAVKMTSAAASTGSDTKDEQLVDIKPELADLPPPVLEVRTTTAADVKAVALPVKAEGTLSSSASSIALPVTSAVMSAPKILVYVKAAPTIAVAGSVGGLHHPIPLTSAGSNGSMANAAVTTCKPAAGCQYICTLCQRAFPSEKYLAMHISSIHRPTSSDTTAAAPSDTLVTSSQSTASFPVATGLISTSGAPVVSGRRLSISASAIQRAQNSSGHQQIMASSTTSSLLLPVTPSQSTVSVLSGAQAVRSAVAIQQATMGPGGAGLLSGTSAGGSGGSQWTCDICHKTFAQNSSYKNHIRTHSDDRPYVCSICSIGFKERYHLKKHVLFKHTTDMNETCRVCGKRFKDSTAVRAHERIHSDVRPYGCPLCKKTFKTSECLWHHENRSKTCGKMAVAMAAAAAAASGGGSALQQARSVVDLDALRRQNYVHMRRSTTSITTSAAQRRTARRSSTTSSSSSNLSSGVFDQHPRPHQHQLPEVQFTVMPTNDPMMTSFPVNAASAASMSAPIVFDANMAAALVVGNDRKLTPAAMTSSISQGGGNQVHPSGGQQQHHHHHHQQQQQLMPLTPMEGEEEAVSAAIESCGLFDEVGGLFGTGGEEFWLQHLDDNIDQMTGGGVNGETTEGPMFCEDIEIQDQDEMSSLGGAPGDGASYFDIDDETASSTTETASSSSDTPDSPMSSISQHPLQLLDDLIPPGMPTANPMTSSSSPASVLTASAGSVNNNAATGASRRHECPRCDKRFASAATLQKHLLVHAEVRPYRCPICDIGFKLKVHLKKHNLYRHSDDYPCECSTCHKRFKDSSAVRLHERIHSSDRPFQCSYCGKSFKTKENLWGHRNRGPCDGAAAASRAGAAAVASAVPALSALSTPSTGSIAPAAVNTTVAQQFMAGNMRLFHSAEFGPILGVPVNARLVFRPAAPTTASAAGVVSAPSMNANVGVGTSAVEGLSLKNGAQLRTSLPSVVVVQQATAASTTGTGLVTIGAGALPTAVVAPIKRAPVAAELASSTPMRPTSLLIPAVTTSAAASAVQHQSAIQTSSTESEHIEKLLMELASKAPTISAPGVAIFKTPSLTSPSDLLETFEQQPQQQNGGEPEVTGGVDDNDDVIVNNWKELMTPQDLSAGVVVVGGGGTAPNLLEGLEEQTDREHDVEELYSADSALDTMWCANQAQWTPDNELSSLLTFAP